VGSYPASFGTGVAKGEFYGIDRIDFVRVAYWRRDFASADLGTLMNALGATPNGVLVPESTGLVIGDSLPLKVSTDIGDILLDAVVVGTFKLFPTWYEEVSGPLFVGNLDYLFQQAGGDSPYQVWVHAAPDINYAGISNFTIPVMNVRVLGWDAALPNILQVQQRPEQQGVFGFLLIGFTAAAILTVVGFTLYALFSYQRRFVELGVLRAGGLSRGQMTTYLAFELIFLVLSGGIVGTVLGAWISKKFIPYLQIGTDVASRVPSFHVIIAWNSILQIYALFGILFAITLFVLVILLERMKIFQAIKLGETV
jgi:putative ABC transport system permease protein